MSLHEALVRRWEEEERNYCGPISAEVLALRQRRVAEYIRDVGVHPQQRHELRRRIELSEACGCNESIAQIVASIRAQVRNGSATVLAATSSVVDGAASPSGRDELTDITGP